MANIYRNVNVFLIDGDREITKKPKSPYFVKVSDEQDNLLITLRQDEQSISDQDEHHLFYKDSDCSAFGKNSIVFHNGSDTLLFQFSSSDECSSFKKILQDFRQGNKVSVFSQVNIPVKYH